MNSYHSVYDTANYMSPFDKVDDKKCFESRDSYFDCLDRQSDSVDNKYKCLAQYEQWSSVCPAAFRKAHSFERQMDKDNQYLYDAAKLKSYNESKNSSYRYLSNSMY